MVRFAGGTAEPATRETLAGLARGFLVGGPLGLGLGGWHSPVDTFAGQAEHTRRHATHHSRHAGCCDLVQPCGAKFVRQEGPHHNRRRRQRPCRHGFVSEAPLQLATACLAETVAVPAVVAAERKQAAAIAARLLPGTLPHRARHVETLLGRHACPHTAMTTRCFGCNKQGTAAAWCADWQCTKETTLLFYLRLFVWLFARVAP